MSTAKEHGDKSNAALAAKLARCPLGWLPGTGDVVSIAITPAELGQITKALLAFTPSHEREIDVIGGTPHEREMVRQHFARSTTPQSSGIDVAYLIARDVAEIPDRTSPDDQPDMMLVTPDELIGIIRNRLECAASATPCIAPMTLMEMRAALRFYANDDHRVWVTFKPGDRERVLQRMKDEPGWIETGEDSRGHEEFIETGARAQTALNLLTDSENDAIDEAMRAADGGKQT